MDTPTRTVGSLARYSCSLGYTLMGSDASECLESEMWSNEPPTCQSELRLCIKFIHVAKHISLIPQSFSYIHKHDMYFSLFVYLFSILYTYLSVVYC